MKNGTIGADAADSALYATPDFRAWWQSYVPEMFASGVVGYVDDRLADADEWKTFDVTRVTCPVIVMHGFEDGMMPVANAHHTASIVPGATLRLFEGFGHVSLVPKTVEVTSELLTKAAFAR